MSAENGVRIQPERRASRNVKATALLAFALGVTHVLGGGTDARAGRLDQVPPRPDSHLQLGAYTEADDEPTAAPEATESSPGTPQAELDEHAYFPLIVQGVPSGIDHGATVVASPTASETPEPSATTTPTLEPPTITPSPEPSATSSPTSTPSPTPGVPIEMELNGADRVPLIGPAPEAVTLINGPIYDHWQYKGLEEIDVVMPGGTFNTDQITEGVELKVGIRPIVEPEPPYINENLNSPEIVLVTASGEISVRPVDENNWNVNGENPCDELEESDGISGDVTLTLGAREAVTKDGTVTEAYVKLDGDETGVCEETIVFPPIPGDSETERKHYVNFRLHPNTGGINLVDAARLVHTYDGTSSLLETEEGRLLLSLSEGSHKIAEVGRPYVLGTADRLWLDADALESLIYGAVSGVVIDRGDVRNLDNPIQSRAFEDLQMAALHNVNLQRIAMDRPPLTLMTQSWISGDGPSEVRRLFQLSMPVRKDTQNEIRIATRQGLDELYGRYGHIPGFKGVAIDSVAFDNARYDRYTLDAPWGSAYGINANPSYKGLHADIFQRAMKHRDYEGGEIYASERGILWSMREYIYEIGNTEITRERARRSSWANFAEARVEAGEKYGNMFIEDRLPDVKEEPEWENILRDALQRNLAAAPNILVIGEANGDPEEVLASLRNLQMITKEHDALLAIPGGIPGMSGIEMARRLK